MSLYCVVDCINFAYKLVLHGPIFYTYYKSVDCQLLSGFYYIMETKLYYEYIFLVLTAWFWSWVLDALVLT